MQKLLLIITLLFSSNSYAQDLIYLICTPDAKYGTPEKIVKIDKDNNKIVFVPLDIKFGMDLADSEGFYSGAVYINDKRTIYWAVNKFTLRYSFESTALVDHKEEGQCVKSENKI